MTEFLSETSSIVNIVQEGKVDNLAMLILGYRTCAYAGRCGIELLFGIKLKTAVSLRDSWKNLSY